MGHTLTIRLTKEQAEWLERAAEETGRTQASILREQLDRARRGRRGRGYMRLAGAVAVATDASERKGYARR